MKNPLKNQRAAMVSGSLCLAGLILFRRNAGQADAQAGAATFKNGARHPATALTGRERQR